MDDGPDDLNLIAEAITEAFGERCPDYEPGCFCCDAWKQYDDLKAENFRLLRSVADLAKQVTP